MPALSFDTLRSWDGSQHRAFEELTFQLLKGRAPNGTRAIRTGNPDGGVEWYATLPDGTEWGWQAKHVRGIDPLLSAMTESVKRVTIERPQLRRLTFVISTNLATGTSGRQHKSQRQKYDDKIQTWKGEIAGADRIVFDLVQESDLLDELAKPEHHGRVWFWWGDLILGEVWLHARLAEQAGAAGEKYRPDLQVDIPIQDDLLALGFDAETVAVLEGHRRHILEAVEDLHIIASGQSKAAILYRQVKARAEALRLATSTLVIEAADSPAVLDNLSQAIDSCLTAVDAASRHEEDLVEKWRALSKDDPKRGAEPFRAMSSYDVRRLVGAIDDLRSWLECSAGQAWMRRSYFLIGQAGSGKTHLFLDATTRALDARRPAVFLAGARFGHGNLWESVTDQLGLPTVGADVLLAAMDSAGEAAAHVGRRFVILIDALNETPSTDFWHTHLPALHAAVAKHPHVALAVSCRDTYRDVVANESDLKRFVERRHPGFAEREVEATQRYFDHYGLEAPKIPLLTPEFTLPLFLRLYCEALSGTDRIPATTGHTGRIEIFERYLSVKVAATARQFRPSSRSNYELRHAKRQVTAVIDALLDDLAQRGSETMSTIAAEEVAKAQLSASAEDAVRVLGILQNEGVLTRERLYLGDGKYDEGVRIVFQAFSDFLLIKRRLAASSDPLNDDELRRWLLHDCSWGVLEAATIFMPEGHGVELVDYLGVKLGREPTRDSSDPTWQRHNQAVNLHRSLVETLPYRSSDAVTERTIQLLNATQPYLRREELYRALFTLAPQPKHRLNGEGLHRYLTKRRMPQRDHDFGIAIYDEIWNEFGPVARLARWAANGPYPTYSSDVIELACIPLCWLLSTPNRYMRDWVTKALVQLLCGHLDVMARLVRRFWLVDDPYVVQRVVAIAYGALLRSTPGEVTSGRAVVRAVSDLVFSTPIRPDELMLDAARGVIRWGATHNMLSAAALKRSKAPLGLKPPGPPPTEETLKAKYWPPKEDDDAPRRPDADKSYSSIRISVMTMGDFGRYVVESGLRHFSRYRIEKPYPERQDRRPRIVRRRLKAFMDALTDDQRKPFKDLRLDDDKLSALRWRHNFEAGLNEEQQALLEAVLVYPKPVDEDYPADAACRWIFRRVLSLGWTPELFGEFDSRRAYHRAGREAHKSERFGKKYQWMAYHELLSRVVDNFHASRLYSDHKPYEGLHEIIADREIDPSLPPINYRAFNERQGEGTNAWKPPPITLEQWPMSPLKFDRYKGNIQALLDDTGSEPSLKDMVFARDVDGSDWVVLDGRTTQVDPLSPKSWRGLQQIAVVHALFVTTGDGKRMLDQRAGQRANGFRDVFRTPEHIDCCYVGEVGRSVGPPCPPRQDSLKAQEGSLIASVAPAEEYTWEGTLYDCSIGESATTILPSAFLQQDAGLFFDQRGPSWVQSNGEIAFTSYEERSVQARALLCRADHLRDFMKAHDVELVVRLWYERRLIDGSDTRHPHVDVIVEGRIDADLKLRARAPRRST